MSVIFFKETFVPLSRRHDRVFERPNMIIKRICRPHYAPPQSLKRSEITDNLTLKLCWSARTKTSLSTRYSRAHRVTVDCSGVHTRTTAITAPQPLILAATENAPCNGFFSFFRHGRVYFSDVTVLNLADTCTAFRVGFRMSSGKDSGYRLSVHVVTL